MSKEPVYVYLIPREKDSFIAEIRNKVKKTPTGKPYFEDSALGCISLSHSGKYFAAAMGNCNLGMDIQEHQHHHDVEALMKRFFHDSEIEYIMKGREEEFLTRFFQVWTAKESYVKYTGTGITDDYPMFSVLHLKDNFSFSFVDVEEGYTLCICMDEPREIRLNYID